jgi:hypothetical protein
MDLLKEDIGRAKGLLGWTEGYALIGEIHEIHHPESCALSGIRIE